MCMLIITREESVEMLEKFWANAVLLYMNICKHTSYNYYNKALHRKTKTVTKRVNIRMNLVAALAVVTVRTP